MNRVRWTIHMIAGSDQDAPGLYAILPNDGVRGLPDLDLGDIRDIVRRLTEFQVDYDHDGEVSEFSEQLGHRWLYTREAYEEYGTPIPSITLACRDGKIADARKGRYGWQFSASAFRTWMTRGRPGPGRPPKS